LRSEFSSLAPMASSPQPAIGKSVVPTLTCAYLVFALGVVYTPELMVAGLWLAGIRPERFGDSLMWPGSWGWAVLWSFSFGLIFGLAAAVGVTIRAGFIQYKSVFEPRCWPG
jgi:hypothetical protein